jgi:hypothetical protein
MISIYLKDFSWEKKMAQICQISKKFKFQIASVLWSLPEGSQEYIQGFCSFSYFHMYYYVAKFD